MIWLLLFPASLAFLVFLSWVCDRAERRRIARGGFTPSNPMRIQPIDASGEWYGTMGTGVHGAGGGLADVW